MTEVSRPKVVAYAYKVYVIFNHPKTGAKQHKAICSHCCTTTTIVDSMAQRPTSQDIYNECIQHSELYFLLLMPIFNF